MAVPNSAEPEAVVPLLPGQAAAAAHPSPAAVVVGQPARSSRSHHRPRRPSSPFQLDGAN